MVKECALAAIQISNLPDSRSGETTSVLGHARRLCHRPSSGVELQNVGAMANMVHTTRVVTILP